MKRYIKSSREYSLEAIPEISDESGQCVCWSMHSRWGNGDGQYHYVWVTKYNDNEFIIEDHRGNNIAKGKTFHSLRDAERAAANILRKQDESGYYTD